MTAKEKEKQNIWDNLDDFLEAFSGEETQNHARLINIEDAIEIAEKYAEEMCKKQNQMNYKGLLSEILEQISLYGRLKHKFLYKVQIDEYFAKAPLATELKDENI